MEMSGAVLSSPADSSRRCRGPTSQLTFGGFRATAMEVLPCIEVTQ